MTDAVTDNSKASPTIPPSIANANAQMPLAARPPRCRRGNSGGPTLRAAASDNADADNRTVVVAADQLNDADRTLQESSSTPTAPGRAHRQHPQPP